MIMWMGVGMMVQMSMIMVMVVRVIMGMLVAMIMRHRFHGEVHTVVVVMNIPLMVVVVVNDQGVRCILSVIMLVMVAVGWVMIVLMVMGVSMVVMMLMVVFMFVTGDPRLAASAYATHFNLPRYR
ncbi:hypothetical protein [Aeromonas enteropelogenes]|uniref:hypothetical protein n=1 Tax=Aeromonas enteropelogenes TaxID=29489 RepID=UPI00288B5C49|nr:hypothetical protein [Aeromonas enteropelogenes]